MEIVSKFDYLLSNAEVFGIIGDNQSKIESGHASGRPAEVTFFCPQMIVGRAIIISLSCLQAVQVETRVKAYFDSLPSKLIRTEHIESLFQRLRAFLPAEGQAGFKQTELMNIANLRPTSLVHLTS